MNCLEEYLKINRIKFKEYYSQVNYLNDNRYVEYIKSKVGDVRNFTVDMKWVELYRPGDGIFVPIRIPDSMVSELLIIKRDILINSIISENK